MVAEKAICGSCPVRTPYAKANLFIKRKLIPASVNFLSGLSENSTRNIHAIREMETFKHEFQIRCSHYELEQLSGDDRITCTICGKNWFFKEERGYSVKKKIYAAERQ